MMRSRVWRRLAGAAAFLVLATAVVAIPPWMETPAVIPPPEGQRFTASDGAALAVRDWQPAGPPRLILVALHGMNDYGLSFEGPARLWASLGIATYALDQRGFGRSLVRGRWYGGTRMADDTLELAHRLRAAHPGVPLALIGESMGGAVAVLAAARAGGRAVRRAGAVGSGDLGRWVAVVAGLCRRSADRCHGRLGYGTATEPGEPVHR